MADWPGQTLTGLSVLDLSSNLAGPLAAMVLGDLGADVIKVERAGRGDDTRALEPRWEGTSTVFHSVNRGKRSIELDLAAPAGVETCLALAERSDVLIESFGPGVARKLGLDFDSVAARSPAIIYGTVSAFGGGPVGSRLPGYDSLIQGFSGMMSITGHPGEAPTRVAPSAIDLSTGLWLVVAIMSALRRRDAGGSGAQHLEAALVDSAFNLMGHQILGMLATDVVPAPLGSGSPSSIPNGAFTAADGWLVLATGNEVQWRRLCGALNVPELADDPRFATIADRIAEREALQATLNARFATDTVDAWIARLEAARVPAGRLNTLREAVEHPLVSERSLLVPTTPPSNGSTSALPQLRLPIDPRAEGVGTPPPRLGEHTEEILAELGLGPP